MFCLNLPCSQLWDGNFEFSLILGFIFDISSKLAPFVPSRVGRNKRYRDTEAASRDIEISRYRPLGRPIRQVQCKLHWLICGEFICAVSEQTVPDKPLPRFQHQFHRARHDSSLVSCWINGKFSRGLRVLCCSHRSARSTLFDIPR